MKLKQIEEDFIVNEVYDINMFKDKKEDRGKPYYYFKLIKTNYTQINAIMKVASIFNTSKKLVHFAGTKDKVGVTSQVVSVYGINEENFDKNLEFFNTLKDLRLEFLGEFDGRVNLGDNLGNDFLITLRDLSDDEVVLIGKNYPMIKKEGVLNFFDSQRFGYANNSHIVGKYVLQNNLEKAVYEILTSLPIDNPSEDLIHFVDKVKSNWSGVIESNNILIDEIIAVAPKFLRSEVLVLEHLKRFQNDFPGAFRKIHKKLRTLYLNAYQSFIFNETLLEMNRVVLDGGVDLFDKITELELVFVGMNLDGVDDIIKKLIFDLLKKDELSFESFELKHMPEIRFSSVFRKVKVFPEELVVGEFFDDDLNEGMKKVEVCFRLGSGEYATNIVKQLF